MNSKCILGPTCTCTCLYIHVYINFYLYLPTCLDYGILANFAYITNYLVLHCSCWLVCYINSIASLMSYRVLFVGTIFTYYTLTDCCATLTVLYLHYVGFDFKLKEKLSLITKPVLPTVYSRQYKKLMCWF